MQYKKSNAIFYIPKTYVCMVVWEGLLSWAILFLIIALVAGLFGFGFIAGTSIEAAKILFYVFIVLFVISIIVRLVRGRW